jgi:hypothetical protein
MIDVTAPRRSPVVAEGRAFRRADHTGILLLVIGSR